MALNGLNGLNLSFIEVLDAIIQTTVYETTSGNYLISAIAKVQYKYSKGAMERFF
jgi:hypothetical protein